MMKLVNLHNHCRYDDGSGSPEEHVESAIANDLDVLGFSCHAPLPFDASWTMNRKDLASYIEEIGSLKLKYKDRIDIVTGLEIDYIPELISPSDKEFRGMGLDYIIGSVHHLDKFPNGEYMPVDADFELFNKGIAEVYFNDIKAAVSKYYTLIIEMVHSGGFDILGHFDLIKKNNRDNVFFSEDSKWYRDLVYMTVDSFSNKDILVEVNTGGMTRKYTSEVYPAPWILKYMCSKKIKIITSSDSHNPQTVISGYDHLRKLLPECGYNDFCVLTSNGRERISL